MTSEAAVVGAGAATGTALGAATPTILTCGVPWAMSTFGTVVPGIGTLHAAGGVAATMQTVATYGALATAGCGLGVGAVVGGGTVVAYRYMKTRA